MNVYLRLRKKLPMPILNSIFGWIIKKRIHQIELFKKYPIDVQNEWMHKLIDTAKNTEYGKKYGFKDIRTNNDFKQNIPINDYDSIKEYIIRITTQLFTKNCFSTKKKIIK